MNVERSGHRADGGAIACTGDKTMADTTPPFDGVFWTLLAIVGCGFWFLPAGTPGETMKRTATNFVDGGAIVTRHTCDRLDTPAEPDWSNVRGHAHSFAVIVDEPYSPDPAAARRPWTHWVMYNTPPGVDSTRDDARGAPSEAGDSGND